MRPVSIDTREGSLHAMCWGRGRPLILLHANGSSHAEFDRLAPLLAADFEVFAWDQPGHGESSPLRKGASISDYAVSLQHFIGALDLQRPLLAGSSVGAFIAAELGNRAPSSVAAVALIEAQWRPREWWEQRWAIVERMFSTPAMTREEVAARLTVPLDDDRFSAWNRDRRIAGGERMLEVMQALARYDLGAAVSNLRVPLKLMYGEKGPTVDNMPVLRSRCPEAEVSVIAGAGHYPALEAPDVLANLLRSWVTT